MRIKTTRRMEAEREKMMMDEAENEILRKNFECLFLSKIY